jgi:hypothetical protein
MGGTMNSAQHVWLADAPEGCAPIRARPWQKLAEIIPVRTYGGQQARYPSAG